MGFYIKKFKKNVFVVFAIIKTPIVVVGTRERL